MSFNALMEVINPVDIICYFQWYRFLGFTLFRSEMSEHDTRQLADVQCRSNMYFYYLFQLLSLTLNLCLCIDLILTIYDPFSPAYRRTKLYYLFSVVSSLVLVIIIFIIDMNREDTKEYEFPCLESSIN